MLCIYSPRPPPAHVLDSMTAARAYTDSKAPLRVATTAEE